eukprot:CAMPEP_0172715698 /NCGR_PEP_ID=MMETSP1074-20121228/67697_1 /TAXON_ID=2916 /ORGANISM="Ceratium fusus, Strain PA161109" /LENGTH=392 /DNA_ID=CAMNT_0013540303 /DNA_START=28 /DNA_END=1206 /DNA_ORIENTATION=+
MIRLQKGCSCTNQLAQSTRSSHGFRGLNGVSLASQLAGQGVHDLGKSQHGLCTAAVAFLFGSLAQRGSVRVRRKASAVEEVECDVCIVGSGPAGSTCALYTARANHKTVMLDKNPATGALAITSHIANYPGVEANVSGQELLEKMQEQAISYGTEYRRAQVYVLDLEGDTKVVYTPVASFKAKVVVLATGAMGRKPSFKGEEAYLGQGVSYCATCDGAFYDGSEVAVAGNNKEAVEEAQFLTKFASTVHWITTGDPKPDVHAEDLLANPKVKHWKARMLSIEGNASGVTGIRVQVKGDIQTLPVEGVFIYVAGSKPMTSFLQEGSVQLNEDGGVAVNDQMATSVPGVFAIGDIRNTPFKQVVVAASDGCIAAMAIDRYLSGRKSMKVDWAHK